LCKDAESYFVPSLYLVDDFAAFFANADFLAVVKIGVTDAGRFAAGRAYKHYLASAECSFLLDKSAVRVFLVGRTLFVAMLIFSTTSVSF
jgi:hypothetical protein